MSGKLDQSLDQIMSDTKPAGGRGPRAGRRPIRKAKTNAKAAITAPSGGVQKNKAATKAAPVVAASLTKGTAGESKIIVSNLPEDVTETLIKVR